MNSWWRLMNVQPPWGDYADMLVGGMTTARDDLGRLGLMRTAPWIPPISLASRADLIVTDAFRLEMKTSGLAGITFREIVKKRIVRIDWRNWDLTAAAPAHLPAGGEPENYIDHRNHDHTLAESIGPLWEVVIGDRSRIKEPADFVRDRGAANPVVASEGAKRWLELHAGDFIRFDPV